MPRKQVAHIKRAQTRRRVTTDTLLTFYRYLRTNPDGILEADTNACVDLFVARYSSGRRPKANSKLYYQMKAWFRKLKALHNIGDE